jgi:hypothetical protein
MNIFAVIGIERNQDIAQRHHADQELTVLDDRNGAAMTTQHLGDHATDRLISPGRDHPGRHDILDKHGSLLSHRATRRGVTGRGMYSASSLALIQVTSGHIIRSWQSRDRVRRSPSYQLTGGEPLGVLCRLTRNMVGKWRSKRKPLPAAGQRRIGEGPLPGHLTRGRYRHRPSHRSSGSRRPRPREHPRRYLESPLVSRRSHRNRPSRNQRRPSCVAARRHHRPHHQQERTRVRDVA